MRHAYRVLVLRKMKDIKGFKGLYAITRDGRVWSYPREVFAKNKWKICKRKYGNKWLKLDNSRSYSSASLQKNDGHIYNFLVHRLVAFAYLPNPLNLPQVNHKNGIRTDNRVENLEWCTASQNKLHSIQVLKRGGFGEQSHKAKLTEKEVLEIRKKYKRKSIRKTNTKKLAKEYCVAPGTIRKIIIKESWKYI